MVFPQLPVMPIIKLDKWFLFNRAKLFNDFRGDGVLINLRSNFLFSFFNLNLFLK